MSFAHENLNVYKRLLAFNSSVAVWGQEWQEKHAFQDHLERAAASALENLSVACGRWGNAKFTNLDYSLGSSLECAACLDLATVKALMIDDDAQAAKANLSEIVRMLIGLRRSWEDKRWSVSEEDEGYNSENCVAPLFFHEALNVYKRSLEFARVLFESQWTEELSKTNFRRMDELTTTVVLNIAEGNGRFSPSDHNRFLVISYEAVLKLAVKLDLLHGESVITDADLRELKGLLEEVAKMIYAMIQNGKSK